MFNLLFGVAGGDVLRAVPIVRLKPKPENRLCPAFVAVIGHECAETLVNTESEPLNMDIYLEPGPSHVVHQKETGPIVGGEIADTYILTIPPVISKGQCLLIDDLEEAGFSSTMLNIRPAGFGDGCDIEAVT